MKKFILLLFLAFIPMVGYSQNSNQDNKKEDTTITINVTKISKTIGGVVKFVTDEVKQFKEEAEAGITPEEKQMYKEAKENVKYELKYIHDAIHAGWAQGWKGENYTHPYKHK